MQWALKITYSVLTRKKQYEVQVLKKKKNNILFLAEPLHYLSYLKFGPHVP